MPHGPYGVLIIIVNSHSDFLKRSYWHDLTAVARQKEMDRAQYRGTQHAQYFGSSL